jgi:PAS domain-containing protein
MGVRKDWPELAGMIDKVLASMSEAEHKELRNKALSVRFEFGVDAEFVTKVALLTGGIVVAIIIVFVAWTRGLGKEIAERKQAEGELAEKEAQMRNALEGMSGGLMMTDKDLTIRVINDKIVDWYDMPKDLAKPGMPLRDLIKIRAGRGDYGPGDAEELTTQRLRDYMDGTAKRTEDRMPDGRILELIRSPTDDGGTVIVCNDITEQKKAEEELAEKEAQVATALASMSGGLFMIDKDFNIKVVNEKIIEWYDLPDGVGRPGTPLRDFLSVRANRGEYGPGDPEELIERRLEGYRDRSIQRIEDHVPGGRVLEVLRSPTDDGGMVVVCNDITESKHAEENLRENLDELEKFNSLAVGRELRMIDLKQEVNDLLKALGKDSEYEIVE